MSEFTLKMDFGGWALIRGKGRDFPGGNSTSKEHGDGKLKAPPWHK